MLRLTLSKLIGYRSFWRFFLLHLLAIPALFYVGSNFVEFSMQNSTLSIGQWFKLPQAWQTVAALSRALLFIPAFFIIQLVCAELELRLVRAHVAAGLERHDVVGSWIVTNALQVLAGSIVSLGTVALLAKSPDSAADWDLGRIFRQQFGYILYGLCFLNMAVLIGLSTRRPVYAIGILMLWPMVIERLLGFVLTRNKLGHLNPYLPFEAMATLVPFPESHAMFEILAPSSLVSIAYGCGFALLAWLRLRQLDL